MKDVKVVVVFPVYNGEKTLHRSLECIAKQTFKEFRAIILENRSTDASLSIAQAFCEQDDRFRVIVNDKHVTAIENLAKGVEIASAQGEYFCLRACDDYSSDDFLERLVKALDDDPSKLLAACATKLTGPRGVRLKEPSQKALNFLEAFRQGYVPRNLTFPAEWIYNLFRAEAKPLLMERWYGLGNAWCFASYVLAAFVVRGLAVYVDGPTYDFTEGSGSEARYGAKSFRDRLQQRWRYTLGCFNLRKDLPKASAFVTIKFFMMCWNDARRKTRYKLLWVF
ncbi:glycosyltransferase family 2 protein [Rhizobium sp. OAE497]|uniref:glycosyltransferase family 2 protein n=1 Tax=Rhizobium sp. OAE497 TaxID=2663796 RepID=UPI0018F52311